MNELTKLNNKIAKLQIGRIVGGVGSVILGTVLISKFIYQKGVTDCQGAIKNEFPEEYSAITEKVVKAFEKE